MTALPILAALLSIGLAITLARHLTSRRPRPVPLPCKPSQSNPAKP